MNKLILEEERAMPKGWVNTNIDSIGKIIHYGYTATSTKKNTGIKYLRITDIQNNHVIWNDVPYCQISQEKKPNFLLHENDIVFVRTGGTVGKSFLIKNDIPTAVFASYLIRIVFTKYTESKFIHFFFQSGNYWHQIQKSKTGLKTNVNAQILSKIVFQLPPLNEQKRIVSKIESIFSQIDAGKEKLEDVRKLLRQARQSVLKSAFEGKLTERWRNNNIIGLEDSDNEKLLNGWIECKLENITQKVLKINPKEYPNQKFQYCDIDSIDNNKLKITSPKKFLGKDAPSRARQLIHVNDILFSTVRTYLHNVGIVPIELDNQLASTGFCVLRNNNLIVNRLIFYLVQTVQFEHYLNPLQRGTSYPAVRNNDVINYVFQLPSIPEQKRIVSKIESIFGRVDAIEKQVDDSLIKLDQLKKSTLKKAFEGKLVPQNPNDEPVSILLERIKQEKYHKQKK